MRSFWPLKMVCKIPLIIIIANIIITSQTQIDNAETNFSNVQEEIAHILRNENEDNDENKFQNNHDQTPNIVINTEEDIDRNAPVIKKAIIRMCVIPERCREGSREEIMPLICDQCERIRKVKSTNKKRTRKYEEINDVNNILNKILEDLKLSLRKSHSNKQLLRNDNPNKDSKLLEELLKVVLKSKSDCDCSKTNGNVDVLINEKTRMRCACLNTDEANTKFDLNSENFRNLRDETTRNRNSNQELRKIQAPNNEFLTNIKQDATRSRSSSEETTRVLTGVLLESNKRVPKANTYRELFTKDIRNKQNILGSRSKKIVILDDSEKDDVVNQARNLLQLDGSDIVDMSRHSFRETKEYDNSENIARCNGPPGYTSCPLVQKYWKKKRIRKKSLRSKYSDLLNKIINHYIKQQSKKKSLTNENDLADIVDMSRHSFRGTEENDNSKSIARCNGPPGYTSCPLVQKYWIKKKIRKKSLRSSDFLNDIINLYLKQYFSEANQDSLRCGCGGKRSADSTNIEDMAAQIEQSSRCGCGRKRNVHDSSDLQINEHISRCGCGSRGIQDSSEAVGETENLRCGCKGKRGLHDDYLKSKDYTRCGCGNKGLRDADNLFIKLLTKSGSIKTFNELYNQDKCGCSKNRADSDTTSESEEESDLSSKNEIRLTDIAAQGKQTSRCGCGGKRNVHDFSDLQINKHISRCGCGSRGIQDSSEVVNSAQYLRCGCGKNSKKNRKIDTQLDLSKFIDKKSYKIDTKLDRKNNIDKKTNKLNTLTGRYISTARCGCSKNGANTDTSSESEYESDPSSENETTLTLSTDINEYTTTKNNTKANSQDKTLRLTTRELSNPDDLYVYLKDLTRYGQKYKVNNDIDAYIVNIPELEANLSQHSKLRTKNHENKRSGYGKKPDGFRLKEKINEPKELEIHYHKFNRKRNFNIYDWLQQMYNNPPNLVKQKNISSDKIERTNTDIINKLDNWLKNNYVLKSDINSVIIDEINKEKREKKENKRDFQNYIQRGQQNDEDENTDHLSVDELLKRQGLTGRVVQQLLEGLQARYYLNNIQNSNKLNVNKLNQHLKSSQDNFRENKLTTKDKFDNGQNPRAIQQAILEALGFNLKGNHVKKLENTRSKKRSTWEIDPIRQKITNTLNDHYIAQQLLHELGNNVVEAKYKEEIPKKPKIQLREIPPDLLAYINELQITRNDLLKSKTKINGKNFYQKRGRNQYKDINVNLEFIEHLLNNLKSQFNLSKNVKAVLIDAKDLEGLEQTHSGDISLESDEYRKTKVVLDSLRAEENTSEVQLTEKEIIKKALILDVLDYVQKKRTKIPTFLNKKQRMFLKKLTSKKTHDYTFSPQELEQQIDDLLFGEAQEKINKLKMKEMRKQQKKQLLQQQKEQYIKEQQQEELLKSNELAALLRSIISPKKQLLKRKTKAVLGINVGPPAPIKHRSKNVRRSGPTSSYGLPFEMDLEMLAQVN